MYAVIETGGKQYKVAEGDKLFIEKLPQADGNVSFEKVLLVSNDNGVMVGQPFIDGAKVEATILKHGKHKKVLMMRYKAKKDLRKKRGHRQMYTQVEIKSIKA